MVANQLYELSEAIGPEATGSDLARDAAANKVLQSLIPIADQSVVKSTIYPCLVELSWFFPAFCFGISLIGFLIKC